MRRVGMTLGKFAPLHHGHQYLIEHAIQNTDELIIVVYDAKEVTPVPLKTRSNWIRELYPNVTVIEGKDGPTISGYTDEIKKIQEDYILQLLNGKQITHFFSSEPYGEHMSKALDAKNCVVDLDRMKFPVSGTAIRNDLFGNRRYIHPSVYKDLITNVVFLGAPSTGKTTIAEACARHLGTVWMPEYGREYWEKNNIDRRLTPEQLVEIAGGHLERENKLLLEAKDFIFTDTNAITTYMFSHYYHGTALPELSQLAEQARARYQLTFLCDTDIPYDDTWDRSGDTNRLEFQQRIISDLKHRKIPYILLSGNVNERVAKVEATLKTFKRYPSI